MIDRQKILSMAKQVLGGDYTENGHWPFFIEELEQYTALVVKAAEEAERKKHQADIELWKGEAAKAELWRGRCLAMDHGDGRTVQQIQAEAIEAERKACAAEVEKLDCAMRCGVGSEVAATIRARGNGGEG